MISCLQLLRNIGQFDNVSTSATLDLKRLTLIYAENGRGKTTIAAILRSLGSGEALPINERRRLGAAHPPEARIACTARHNQRYSKTVLGIVPARTYGFSTMYS